MLKNVFMSVLVFIMFSSLGICSEARINGSKYYEVLVSTSSSVTVSSTTVTTLSGSARYGFKREFAISGTCDGTVFYQKGGSTTTVAAAGIPMKENEELYVDDNYFGDIYFQTDTSTATLRILNITVDR